ncbi:hypothetical protein LI90_3106 [Carbonactinospora thermoautotrophica]|uniref:Uncharacterized protein n=1 Tax=Carbonactinospora thermoautotrophica TaxID=1469144 RepID=A0A132MW66_9ACTN|nr:hypothetical protein LI90_3106 [Carbonactinospora thermoautotrophica]
MVFHAMRIAEHKRHHGDHDRGHVRLDGQAIKRMRDLFG